MWKKTENEDGFIEEQSVSPIPAMTSSDQPSTGGLAIIGFSITVNGDISGEEDLIIQGKIEGTVNLEKNNLVVGKDGQVKADIKAKVITVEGEVIGNLYGNEQIIIKRSGSVDGNISAPRLVIEDGCKIKGAVEMGESVVKPKIGSAPAKTNVTGPGSSLDENKSNTDKNINKTINDSLS